MRNKGLPLIELTRLSETLKRSPGHPSNGENNIATLSTVLANSRGLSLPPTVIVTIFFAIFIIILLQSSSAIGHDRHRCYQI